MAKLSPLPVWSVVDAIGVTVPGALLYAFEAGTSTPKETFTDHTGAVAATNPIVADSAGRLSVWLGPGYYKLVLTNGEDATLFDPDHIEGTIIWTKDYVSASGGGGDSSLVLSVENIEALRALTGYDDGTIVNVRGYFTENDGGGGWFYYKDDSTDADNGGTVILDDSTPATGRWIRFVNRPVDVRWFGAGFGYDDSVRAQKAYDFAASVGADVLWGKGDYSLETEITVAHSCKTEGVNASIIKSTARTTPIFTADEIDGIGFSGLEVVGLLCELTGCSDVEIKDNKIEALEVNNFAGDKLIDIKGCTRVRVHGNYLTDMERGIRVTSDDDTIQGVHSADVEIFGNYLANTQAPLYALTLKGVSVIYADRVNVHDNHIANIYSSTHATYRGYAVHISQAADVSVRDNILTNSGGECWEGVYVSDLTNGGVVQNNIIRFSGSRTAETPIGIHVESEGIVSENKLFGCRIYGSYTSGLETAIRFSDNHIEYCYGAGIQVDADPDDTVTVSVIDNHIKECGYSGIRIEGADEVLVAGNSIVNANKNQSSTAELSRGIYFSGVSRGVVKDNNITNNLYGHALYGIDFGENDETTKWVYKDNSFLDMSTGNYLHGYSSFPYGAQWSIGERAYNTALFPADALSDGWKCIAAADYVTSAAADPEDTTIEVSGATLPDIKPGDVIGVVLDTGTAEWTTVRGILIDGTTVTVTPDDKLSSGVLSGAVVYIRRWRNIEYDSVDILVEGGDAAGYRAVYLNGRRVLYSNDAGLSLSIYDAETMVLISTAVFTLEDGASETAFIAALAAMTSGYVGVIASAYSSLFQAHLSDDVQTELKRHGLFKLAALYTMNVSDYSYAGIFIGADASGINRQAFEVSGSGVQSRLQCLSKEGHLTGNSLPSVLVSGDPASSTPAITTDNDGGCLFGGRIVTKRGTDVTVTGENVALLRNGFMFLLTAATVTTVRRLGTDGWPEGSTVLLLMGQNVRFELNAANSGAYAGLRAGFSASSDIDGTTNADEIKPIPAILINKPAAGGGTELKWYLIYGNDW